MAKLTFEVSHALPKEEARQRIEQLTLYWKSKYGLKSEWTGDEATLAGKVMGVTIDGIVRVAADRVGGDATDPGLLLRGQARKYLQGKFANYLDPKKSLAELKREQD